MTCTPEANNGCHCHRSSNDRSAPTRTTSKVRSASIYAGLVLLGTLVPVATGLVTPVSTTARPSTDLKAFSIWRRRPRTDVASIVSSETSFPRRRKLPSLLTRKRRSPLITPIPTSTPASSVSTVERKEVVRKQEEDEKNANYNWTPANLGIALPALLGLLADPVLSMVDTGFVGRISAIDLAALGVCTSIFHMSFTIFRASTVATTSLVGSAKTKKDARMITKISMQLAGVLGTMVLLALRLGGPALLGTMGVSKSSPLYEPACSYLFARCWAAPAVVGIVVAEGAFRGTGDSRTPLVASAVATLINLVLDPLLMFPLGMGMGGAAAATALSQLGAAGVYAWRMIARKHLPQKEDKDTAGPSVKTSSILKAILGANLAMLAKQGSMLVFYTYATALATRMGAVHVATHQVALSFFWLVTFWLDSGSISGQVLMSQSQMAKDNEKKDDSTTATVLEVEPVPDRNVMSDEGMADAVVAVNEENEKPFKLPKTPFKARSLTKYMAKYAAIQGVVCAALVAGVGRFLPAVFTTDATVQGLLIKLLPHLAIQQVIVSLSLVLEGMAIGGDQYRFMAVGTSLATAFGIWQLSCATSVVGIWSRAVTSFFVARLAVAICGVWRVHRGMNRQYAEKQAIAAPLRP